MLIDTRTAGLIKQLIISDRKNAIDDKYLCLSFWEAQGLKLTEDQKKYFLQNCLSPETITRNRRKLAETHKYLFPSEVIKQRLFNEEQTRKHIND